MTPLGWAFIGLVGLVCTLVALVGPAALRDPEQADITAIICGTLSVIAWGVWAYQALSIRVGAPDGSGTELVSYPAVALLGAALALPGAYVALTGPLELVAPDRAREIER